MAQLEPKLSCKPHEAGPWRAPLPIATSGRSWQLSPFHRTVCDTRAYRMKGFATGMAVGGPGGMQILQHVQLLCESKQHVYKCKPPGDPPPMWSRKQPPAKVRPGEGSAASGTHGADLHIHQGWASQGGCGATDSTDTKAEGSSCSSNQSRSQSARC